MSKESSIKVYAENFSGSDKPVNAIPVWIENASAISGGGGGGGSIPSDVSGKWEDASDCVQTNSGTWGQGGGSTLPSAFVVSADGQAYKARYENPSYTGTYTPFEYEGMGFTANKFRIPLICNYNYPASFFIDKWDMGSVTFDNVSCSSIVLYYFDNDNPSTFGNQMHVVSAGTWDADNKYMFTITGKPDNANYLYVQLSYDFNGDYGPETYYFDTGLKIKSENAVYKEDSYVVGNNITLSSLKSSIVSASSNISANEMIAKNGFIAQNYGYTVGNIFNGDYGYEGNGTLINTNGIVISPKDDKATLQGTITLSSISGLWNNRVNTTAEINAFDWNKLMDLYNTVQSNSATW